MARPKKPPDPNAYVSPGKGKGKKGPRPHVWICGPDEYKHQISSKVSCNYHKIYNNALYSLRIMHHHSLHLH